MRCLTPLPLIPAADRGTASAPGPAPSRRAMARGYAASVAQSTASAAGGRQRAKRRKAFTLIEMLVVISIVGILVGIAIPVIGRMSDSNQMSSGVNTVSLAAETTRRLAESRNYDVGFPLNAEYDGAAMIIAPSGEIRLTINHLTAQRPGGAYTEEQTQGTLPPGSRPWNAYRDAAGFDYIQLPGGVDIYGINRAGAGVVFMPPPFAVRFDQSGRLISGSSLQQASPPGSVDRLVFYDHDVDDEYVFDPIPASGSNLTSYNNDPSNNGTFWKRASAPVWVPAEEKFTMPFGTYVAVPGVRIVQDGEDPNNPATEYVDVLFSRNTGTAQRINRQP